MEQDKAFQLLAQCYIGEIKKRDARIEWNTPLDSSTQEKLGKAAKWLTGNYKTGLLLYGTVGSGKTTIANAICELISIIRNPQGRGVLRVSANTLVELKTAKDVARSEESEYKFNVYRKCEMLFIDDIGTESVTIKTWGNDLTPVIDLLYNRYEKQLFTIITSNLDNNGIREFYGERIADRFVEMFDTISYTGSSYRK